MAGFFDTIILLGALQGFIVSALLFFSGKNKLPNRLLATLLFLLALASLNLYLTGLPSITYSRVWNIILAIVPMVVVMPVGPLIYFYTHSCLDEQFTFSKTYRKHFYPVIIDLVPCLFALVCIIGLRTGLLRQSRAWGNFIDTYNVYADIPRWLSVTGYLWLSARYISASGHNRWLQQYIRVFLCFQLVWLVYLVPYTIPRYTGALLNAVSWYPVYVPLAILIYWLGIKGYMMGKAAAVPAKKAILPSALPLAAIQQTMGLLKKAMEEDKLYLDAGLNLAMMAAHTGMSQKTVSAVLNQHMHKSFNEFVNAYRVEAFKAKIQEPEMNHLTIAGVAIECGFNSQASFQRIFKQFTGMVPSEFRDNTSQIRI